MRIMIYAFVFIGLTGITGWKIVNGIDSAMAGLSTPPAVVLHQAARR